MLILSLISLGSSVTIFVTGFILASIQIKDSALNELQAITIIQKNKISDSIKNSKALASTNAARPNLLIFLDEYKKTGNPDDLQRIEIALNGLKNAFSDIRRVTITDTNGINIVSTDKIYIGKDRSNEEFFIEAKTGKVFYDLSKFEDGSLGIRVSSPMYKDNKLFSVMSIILEPTGLINFDYAGLGKTGEIFMIKKTENEGIMFITPTRSIPDAAFKLNFSKEVLAANHIPFFEQTEGVFDIVSDPRGKHVLSAQEHIPEKNWNVIVVEDYDEVFAPLYQTLTILSMLSIIILGITLLVANYFSKILSNPIAAIRKISHKIASNEFDVTVNIKSHDEVEDLAKDIEHMSKELKKSYDRLKSESDLKNQFINIAAHELRSPVQPILSHIELYKKGLIEKEEAFKIIDSEAHRLQKLTNDILDIARIESGTFGYDVQRVRINDIIQKVCDSINPILNKDVELELELEENVGIDADPDRLYQAFANVIGNAVKFTKKGKIKIETEVLPEKKIWVKISDTAGGIPQEILPKLFEKFATKNVGAEQSQGTGLGLCISKAIVVAHKGEISAYNNEQGGATFTIILPVNTNSSNQ